MAATAVVFPVGRDPMRDQMTSIEIAKAIVTDAHFLIPVVVLLIGIGLLVALH